MYCILRAHHGQPQNIAYDSKPCSNILEWIPVYSMALEGRPQNKGLRNILMNFFLLTLAVSYSRHVWDPCAEWNWTDRALC
jgi:hypothetical protein